MITKMKHRLAVSTLGALVVLSVLTPPGSAAPVATDSARPQIGVDAGGHLSRATPAPAATSRLSEIPDIPWPPAGVVPPKHSAEKLREFGAAMGERLAKSFPQVVPEAQNMQLTPWSGEWTGVIEDGQDYLTTWAVYHDKIGRTATAYQIEAPGHFTSSPRKWCEINSTTICTATKQPDGSLVLHGVSKIETGKEPRHIESALHYRLDGTVVWTSAYDYDPIFDPNQGPNRDKIALTTAQLTELATDPALHL
ncbi:hypothetical protein NLX83_08760 [Allokutzneria sp. A3M-2-11 16]|uniref:hypothetical protein n=1 Tax=Allokutzneria sp. A3M-2-11 16 TaxID=2962043 RepID=UPI0020B88819|nr:hypothetical protein [Allokutzneria sp. A3M-2-11 16]MCP3799343.1 hypothetical protein [Allokutzneria sp. A3M-2-11 16]